MQLYHSSSIVYIMACISYLLLAVFGWTLIFSLHLVSAQNGTEECDLFYTEQPMTQHTCNPYLGRFRLRCALYRPKGVKNHTIYWYRSLIDPSNYSVSSPELLESSLVRRKEKLLIMMYNPGTVRESDSGIYWCQAGLQGDTNSSYATSQQYTLLPSSVYENYPPCIGLTLSQQSSMCARNGIMLAPLSSWPDNVSSTVSTDTDPPVIMRSMEMERTLIIVSITLSFFITTLCLLLLIVSCMLRSKGRLKKADGVSSDSVTTTNTSEGSQAAPLTSTYPRYKDQVLAVISTEQAPNSVQEVEDSGYVDIKESSFEISGTSRQFANDMPAPSQGDETPNTSISLQSQVYSNPTVLSQMAPPSHTTGRNGVKYHIIDPNKKDRHIYTGRRQPPPVLPKPAKMKLNSQTRFGTQGLSVLVTDSLRNGSEHAVQGTDKEKAFSKSGQRDEETHSLRKPPNSNFHLLQPHSHELTRKCYQPLNVNTTDYLSVYSSISSSTVVQSPSSDN